MSLESENCDEEYEDARRYRWLAGEFEKGKESYIGEACLTKRELDAYIDIRMTERPLL